MWIWIHFALGEGWQNEVRGTSHRRARFGGRCWWLHVGCLRFFVPRSGWNEQKKNMFGMVHLMPLGEFFFSYFFFVCEQLLLSSLFPVPGSCPWVQNLWRFGVPLLAVVYGPCRAVEASGGYISCSDVAYRDVTGERPGLAMACVAFS